MIYPGNFESKTGFDQVRDLIKSQCLCQLGARLVDEMQFSISQDFILEELHLANEFTEILRFEDHFPTNFFIDLSEALKKLSQPRSFLELQEIYDLKRSLETIKAIISFFKTKEKNKDKYVHLKKLSGDVAVYPFILDRIDSILTKKGTIKDNASKNLADIRKTLQSKHQSISKTAHSLLQKAQQAGIVDPDVSISVRDGRMTIPVDASKKRAIKGYILDESSTGKTVYVEPNELIALNNDIRELEFEERREIVNILVSFTGDIRPYEEELKLSYNYLARIDFTRAKAAFALKINAVMPEVNNQPVIKWANSTHPLLYLAHQKQNKEVVPLNIELSGEKRILLISGPNAGGKSVCLKTTGLLQYMLQCGLLVPCSPDSVFGIFKHVFIDIGDEQSIENDLSTYSSHLLHMKNICKNSDGESLVLIDEFGTGTEPMIGGSIAEAILETLNNLQTYGVITTHYTNLKHFASATPGIENAAMLYDHQKLEPTFQLAIGKPGSSFAFEIAKKIGLPDDILEKASNKMGKENVSFDKHLKDISRDKRYWENKRQKIRKSEKKLEELIASYQLELDSTKKLRKDVISKAKKEAEDMLAGTNKLIENTIREIRENQAEKEKTKAARQKLEDQKRKLGEEKPDKKVNLALQQAERNKKALHKKRPDLHKTENKDSKAGQDGIKVGDRVKLKGQDTVGEVMDINKQSVMVGFGSMITTVKMNKLEKTEENIPKSTSPGETIAQKYDMNKRRLNFRHEIDLRGKRAEEALQMVANYIDEAIMLNVSEIRILHGKGFGVLRQSIRDYLSGIDEISHFSDEHLERGGSGITVVKF